MNRTGTSTRLPDDLEGWPLELTVARYSADHHGDFPRWTEALASLPPLASAEVEYGDTVRVSGIVDNKQLRTALMALHPWRKGPFQIGDVFIDAEWRSDWKWQRLAPALGAIDGQRVLDIGCGNGYFGWRLLAAGAREVVGIDPTLLFCMQHQAIQRYTRDQRNWVLPLGIDEIPAQPRFDLVLSMGVIYHRRNPQAHVRQLAALTQPGGRVVLESLIVEKSEDLVPAERYARMRNVWCVPRTATLAAWLRDAGFREVSVVSVDDTTTGEQRSTDWMRFDSLDKALAEEDSTRTIEGYPAPRRALLMARH